MDPSEPFTPNIHNRTPKPLKKKKSIKFEKKLKLKDNVKIDPIAIKQLRALTSEALLPKHTNTCTRQQAKLMEELNNCFEEKDDEILAITDIFEDNIDSRDKDPAKI